MRIEDIVYQYAVIFDNTNDFKNHIDMELIPHNYDYDTIVEVIQDWCVEQFGPIHGDWRYYFLDHVLEDHFEFKYEHHRTLFLLRWT
jgi:hypothetical protein